MSWPGPPAGAAIISRAGLEASLKIQMREPLDGPAMRPETPLAVENGVGKLAAYTAPNVSMEIGRAHV